MMSPLSGVPAAICAAEHPTDFTVEFSDLDRLVIEPARTDEPRELHDPRYLGIDRLRRRLGRRLFQAPQAARQSRSAYRALPVPSPADRLLVRLERTRTVLLPLRYGRRP